jgi:hypothetical protein
MALIERIEKQADSDLVRAMLAFAADRIMDLEVELRTGAAKGARSPLREVQRNGYRDRDWVDEGQEMVRGTISPRKARRSDRAGDPEAAQEELPPELSGAAADGGEGLGRSDPGGLCPRHFHPFGR